MGFHGLFVKCNSECDMYEIYNPNKYKMRPRIDLYQGVFINEEDCGSYFVCNDNGAGLKVGSI